MAEVEVLVQVRVGLGLQKLSGVGGVAGWSNKKRLYQLPTKLQSQLKLSKLVLLINIF